MMKTLPAEFRHRVNRDLFTAYVRKELAPQLRPGVILVLDNPQTHNEI